MEDVVNFNDVLMSMVESLVEKQPVAFTDTLVYQDAAIKFKIGGKPPREIFYRNTLTFMTKLPPAVQTKLCSCKYLCVGAPAEIKCHSCSIYDPKGMSFFCQDCFDAYHPSHRVPHLFVSIDKDEYIPHTLKVSHRIAEANRYEKEGGDMLTHLRGEYKRLNFVADDASIDDKMRIFGRRALVLEDELQALRSRLQKDIYGEPPAVPANNTIADGTVKFAPSLVSAGPEQHSSSNYSNAHSNASSSLLELSKHARTESNVSQFSQFTSFTATDDEDDGDTAVGSSASSSFYNYSPAASFHSSVRPTAPGSGEREADPDHLLKAACCVRIQSAYKGHVARLTVSLMMMSRFVRVWSAAEARGELLVCSSRLLLEH